MSGGEWRNIGWELIPETPLSPVLGPFLNDPPVADAPAWRARRGLLLRALEHHVYGACPAPVAADVIIKESIAPEDAAYPYARQMRERLGAGAAKDAR